MNQTRKAINRNENNSVARKSANSTVRPQDVGTAGVELDAKHVDSPLCACKDCNDVWLAKRDQPLSMKHVKHTVPPLDVARKKEFVDWCKRLGVVQIELRGEHNPRIASWCLRDTQTGYSYTTGFDVDVVAVLTRMEQESQMLMGAVNWLHAPRHASVVKSTGPNAGTLTGGPWCVMCGEPGGLPSPNMVGAAKLLNLRLHFEAGDVRLSAARLHPGHCRKRLRKLLDTVTDQTFKTAQVKAATDK